ncbi:MULTISPECIES: S1 domain-containing post-transcriptional regulator GSP13 [unclassified Virgibacillus]|uniref:S1 domain-containing post-transcriptional regulator GSP13 n=1 Tax=unclassified Virgibacillus TaxID=2620237 RepID=UPI0024DECF21|nr:S1 domain-containing post-transcriptional regulator GSP13 [Virgibacillus sp. LDC-1]
MTNKFEVGQIIEGKVAGIQPYGAFVALDDEVQGLVHISEVTHGFVKDINEHLSIGDTVNVKVLSIDEASNKISLSIRATVEAPKTRAKSERKNPVIQQTSDNTEGFNTLKDKLQEWIDQSESREKTYKN